MSKRKKNKSNQKPSSTAGNGIVAVKPKWRHILLIAILGFLVYSNSLNNAFVYDDYTNIVDNEFIKSWKNISDIFTSRYYVLAQEKSYRPVTTISYFIDYSLWKLNVNGWHLTNIILHSLNAVLIFILINMIVGNNAVALITALLFIVHPIHTETVNVASFREDLISLLFYLGSFILYIKYRYMEKTSILKILFILTVYMIALLAKEMAVTLPVIILLYEAFLNKKNIRNKTVSILSLLKRPIISGFFIVISIYMIIGRIIIKPEGNVFGESVNTFIGYPGGSIYTAILTVFKAVVFYLSLLIVPLRLSIDHVFKIPTGIGVDILLNIIIVTGIIYCAIMLRKRFPEISFSIWYFIIAFLPVSNLMPIGVVIAERYMYFPAIGYCLMLGIVSNKYSLKINTRGKLINIIAIALIVLYGLRTYIRNNDYKSEIMLCSKTLEGNPRSARVLNDRAAAYSRKGSYDEALNDYNSVLNLYPEKASVYGNRAYVYFKQKRYKEAIADFDRMIALAPANYSAYNDRGVIYATIGYEQEALNDFNKSLEIYPGNPNGLKYRDMLLQNRNNTKDEPIKTNDSKNNLKEHYYQMGLRNINNKDYDNAIYYFNKAIEKDPEYSAAYRDRGVSYERKGKIEEAINNFSKAIEYDSKNVKAYYNRGLAYKRKGNYNKAIENYNEAILLNPDYADVYNNRGVVYAMKGNIEKAIEDFSKVMELKPENIQAYKNRAIAYRKQGKENLAQKDEEKARVLRAKLKE